MRKRLLNNWGLKLISLVLAFLLWFLVVQIGDPKDDRDMGNIQVHLINTELLEKENKVYEIVDGTDTVRVTVYAPKSVFTQLRNSDIVAEADVSKLTDINTIPIDFTASTANVVVKGSHDVVKLNIEDKASKYVPLISTSVGKVADGYVATTVTPDQNRIEVSGPKSIVEQVKYAGAEIDVTDASSNLTANVDVQLYSADGTQVDRSRLKKNVEYVRMSVEVLAMKEVPLVLATTGLPKDGYMIAGEISALPSNIRVAGTAYVLSRVHAIEIPATAVDITDAEENVSKTVDIREFLPEGVKLADTTFNGKVIVTIPVEPVVERSVEVLAKNISVKNVPDGQKVDIVEAADASFGVVMAGLREQISGLQSENVKGVIDIAAWMSEENMQTLKNGSYNVPVTMLVEDGISVRNEVTVKIVVKDK